MSAQSLAVAFGGHRVDIGAEVPEVEAALRRQFQWMPADASDVPAGTVGVRFRDGRYEIDSPGFRRATAATARGAGRAAQYRAIQLLVRARDDLVWLHAAAAARDGRALLLAGTRGAGKSTLVARLWEDGWTFITDDILPVDPRSDAVLPFPQAPAVRDDIGRDIPPDDVPEIPKTIVTLDRPVARAALPIAAVALPLTGRRIKSTGWRPCTRGEVALELLQGCWNVVETRDRYVGYLCDLVTRLAVGRLEYVSPGPASVLLTAWAAGGFQDP